MTSSDLDLRLQRFRSRRDEYPHALASALIEAGRSSDALEVIHLGLLDDEANLELLTLEGRAYYVQGDLQEAQRSLLRAAKVDPRHKEPYRWLAQVLIERGDALRAVQVLERAIGLDPNDAALRQSYARAQRMAGAGGARRDSSRPSAPRASTPPVSAQPVSAQPVSAQPVSAQPVSAQPSKPAQAMPRPSKSTPPAARNAAPAAQAQAPAASREPRAQPRPASTTPSALGPAVKRPPENQNAGSGKRGGISDLVARATALRSRAKPQHDLVAEDLLREPLTDAGNSAPQKLPYEGETERDDESPTTAVEVPEEVRSWLRGGKRPSERAPSERPAPQARRPSERPPQERLSERPLNERPSDRPRPNEQVLDSDDDDDESSVPTSIVPAHQELEALRRIEAAQTAQRLFGEPEESETTLIAQHHELLAEPGQAEPPEQVLQLLQTQGVFETGGRPAVQQGWLGTTEIPFVGTTIRRTLLVAWGLAILVALAGYYGFQSWLDTRRAEASGLVEQARAQALDGQHESFLAAEKTLTEARTLDPKSDDALRELLFVEAARSFDDGNGDLGPLRTALARAQQSHLDAPIVAIVKVLVQPPEQKKRDIEALIKLADSTAADDARASYVAARIAQHAGELDATKRLLTKAALREPALAVAQVALGEQARASGELEKAYEAFDKALGSDRKQLRAELWLALLETKGEDTAGLSGKLDALMPRVDKGSDADKLLAASVRAFAAQAAGDSDKAKDALRVGSSLHVDDPELLALFSEQALRAGEHTLAYRAARAASEAGGDAARFQPLIAAAQQSEAALTNVASVGDSHGALALARASAALLTDARESLEAAKKELASYRQTPAGRDDVEAGALLIRVDLRLGANVESLLPAARALVARAPGMATHLALGEALLAAGQGTQALAALDPALKLEPGSADAHFLYGRAQRLAGKPADARASFERAVAIAPNHVQAQRALGRCLLDAGEFDAALTLFRSLESAAGSTATLGVVEALIDKGDGGEAGKRLDALDKNTRATPAGQALLARLDLLRGNPLEAVKTLEPLVAEDAESRTSETLTLYGDALYAADRVDTAAGAYDDAIELDENNPDALIGRAVAAMRANKPDPALTMLNRAEAALVQHPRPPRVRGLWMLTLGRAELQKNQVSPALDHLTRAIATPGVPNEAHFWYAEALSKNKSEKATEEYARYLALEPNGLYAARAKRATGAH